MMTTTDEMLSSLGILGNGASAPATTETPLEPSAATSPETSPTAAASAAEEAETVSLDEALAELSGASAPQDPAASEQSAEAESEPEAEADAVEALRQQIQQLQAEKEALLAEDAEEQFEADWEQTISDGQEFYRGLIADVKERGYQNGRTRAEIDAVIKHMIYDGNEIERLGAPPGTPGFIEWQRETLVNYAVAKAQRGQTKAAPTELERLTTQYSLTDEDQATLRRFANYPPEAREEIAKSLGSKNTKTTTRKQQAEEVAATNVAARLSNQATPGVPGPAPKAKKYQYTHEPAVRTQETELFARSLGLIR
jgi:hypothetical protein